MRILARFCFVHLLVSGAKGFGLPGTISDRSSWKLSSGIRPDGILHRQIPRQNNPLVMMKMMPLDEIVFNFESIANELANFSLEDPSNLATSLPIMYGAGLLTSVSPCVWGLLPLTISYISTAAGERRDKQTTLPTLAFAAGLAVVFCSLGITVAQLGGVLGGAGNKNELLAVFSNSISFVMGLQLLGFVNLALPALNVLQSGRTTAASTSTDPILIDAKGQIVSTSEKKEEGSLFRTFLLGGSSALVASPCATPVLTSILAFVAKAQSPALGALLLFGYTLGYSTPLLLIASAGSQALVDLRRSNERDGFYGKIAPWVVPLTGGFLLAYGTNGLLTALLGDPSVAGLQILE